MKCSLSNGHSELIVVFLILIQITVNWCYVQSNDTLMESGSVSYLPENYFANENADTVTVIHIDGNTLTTLPESIFNRLTNLDALHLNHNQLVALPENIFKSQTKLKELILWENRLTALPANIFESLTELETLDISWNQLTTLPENIFESLTELESLTLSENQITTLPRNIFKSQTKLKELIFWDNRLTALPANIFESLTELETLDISWNQLTTLPENIFRSQTKLSSLEIRYNPWLCDCDFLEEIRPKIDILTYVPTTVCVDRELVANKINAAVTSMKMYELSESEEYDPKYVKKICKNRSSNETTRICPSECNCLIPDDNSSILFDCSNSSLKSVPSELFNVLQHMPSLEEIELYFDNNELTTLPNSTMQGFDLITKISAKNNSIGTINLENLPLNLKEINLSGNKLNSFSIPVIQHLNDMKSLQKMTLGENPLECDCDFLQMAQDNSNKLDFEKILCADGVRLANIPIISMISKKPTHTNEYEQKYVDKTICRVLATNKITAICPSECICLFPSDKTSIFFDCANYNLTAYSTDLSNVLQQMPSVKEIEIKSNTNLTISTMQGINIITKITAVNED